MWLPPSLAAEAKVETRVSASTVSAGKTGATADGNLRQGGSPKRPRTSLTGLWTIGSTRKSYTTLPPVRRPLRFSVADTEAENARTRQSRLI
ncbi:MAG: hypothetical protein DMF03_07400 [Verrucomicrobia bacterium]|nr:MAG: hypothetical protein DMF03_07400 [Verrucomicrobiota bacterium]